MVVTYGSNCLLLIIKNKGVMAALFEKLTQLKFDFWEMALPVLGDVVEVNNWLQMCATIVPVACNMGGRTSMAKYTSIDDYIDAQPKKQAALLQVMREAILQAVPDAEETFNYGVPAFALVKDGKRDQQIMIAGFKNHVGLYPHPSVIEHFEQELSPYKQGKGSIQFPLDQPIPAALIVEMVRYRKQLIDE
jgi:uncharacterized protein YdhG (YjbR/CyaY superfamily)